MHPWFLALVECGQSWRTAVSALIAASAYLQQGDAAVLRSSALDTPMKRATEPPALVPKIEALRSHIAEIRRDLQTWDQHFARELEQCITGGNHPSFGEGAAGARTGWHPTIEIAGSSAARGSQV